MIDRICLFFWTDVENNTQHMIHTQQFRHDLDLCISKWTIKPVTPTNPHFRVKNTGSSVDKPSCTWHCICFWYKSQGPEWRDSKNEFQSTTKISARFLRGASVWKQDGGFWYHNRKHLRVKRHRSICDADASFQSQSQYSPGTWSLQLTLTIERSVAICVTAGEIRGGQVRPRAARRGHFGFHIHFTQQFTKRSLEHFFSFGIDVNVTLHNVISECDLAVPTVPRS